MIECTLTKFANDIELGTPDDILGQGCHSERDLDRLEEWAKRNLMKFNEDKCQALHPGGKKTLTTIQAGD